MKLDCQALNFVLYGLTKQSRRSSTSYSTTYLPNQQITGNLPSSSENTFKAKFNQLKYLSLLQIASPHHWGLSAKYLHLPNQYDQTQPSMAPIPPSAAPPQCINLDNIPATSNTSTANKSLCLQYLHSPNWLEQSTSETAYHLPKFLIEILTVLSLKYNISLPYIPKQHYTAHHLMPESHHQLSPQYLHPPTCNCIWRPLISFTQLHLYRTNPSLSPQYLFPPNIVF